jgi:hypothetical protein
MPDSVRPEEIEQAKTRFLGGRDYRLVDFGYLGDDFEAIWLDGHRIVVRGYIIRQKEFDRISVTSIADISADCR